MTTSGQDRWCAICGARTSEPICPLDGMSTLRVEPGSRSRGKLSAGRVIAKRYRLGAILGRGGFGEVFEATHLATGQALAMKVLGEGTHTPETVRRFAQEARVCANLKSPHTVRVFDFGQEEDGLLFLVMERLEGITLKQELLARLRDEQRVFEEEEAVQIGLRTLYGLEEAHAAGLVHRDLKASNLFLHELPNGRIELKILDFGIARPKQSSLTATGGVIGTPAYMSPEQAQGKEVDGRSDFYSLGLILFLMIAGRLPFRGRSLVELMSAHIEQEAPCLETLAQTQISDRYCETVRRALMKDPRDRFESAATFAAALAGVELGSEPSPPGEPSSTPLQEGSDRTIDQSAPTIFFEPSASAERGLPSRSTLLDSEATVLIEPGPKDHGKR